MRASAGAAALTLLLGLGCSMGSPEDVSQEVWVTEVTRETGDCPLPTFFERRLMRLGLEPDPADDVHILKLVAEQRVIAEGSSETSCMSIYGQATCRHERFDTPEQTVVWQLKGESSRTFIDATTELVGICHGDTCSDLGDASPQSCEGSLSWTATQLVSGTVREPVTQDSCSQLDTVRSPEGAEAELRRIYVANSTSSNLRIQRLDSAGGRSELASITPATWFEAELPQGTWLAVLDGFNDNACVSLLEVTEADQVEVVEGWRD